MKNVFDKTVVDELIARLDKLTPQTQPQWGTMNVAQMLAHCNVSYEMVYDNKHPKPGAIMRFILKTLVKEKVVGEKTYKHGERTAPQFLVSSQQDFDKERSRLIGYVRKTQELGPEHFEGKESHSFGKLSTQQWSNMFYKHLDHHLQQFGA